MEDDKEVGLKRGYLKAETESGTSHILFHFVDYRNQA